MEAWCIQHFSLCRAAKQHAHSILLCRSRPTCSATQVAAHLPKRSAAQAPQLVAPHTFKHIAPQSIPRVIATCLPPTRAKSIRASGHTSQGHLGTPCKANVLLPPIFQSVIVCSYCAGAAEGCHKASMFSATQFTGCIQSLRPLHTIQVHKPYDTMPNAWQT